MESKRNFHYDPRKWGDQMEMQLIQRQPTGTSVKPPPPPRGEGKGKNKKKKNGKFFLDTVTDGVRTAKKYFDSIAELLLLVGILRKQGTMIGSLDRYGRTIKSKKELMQDIPFNWSSVKGGTQYPTIRLFIGSTNITTTTNTLYNTTFSLTASKLLNFTDFQNIFDEYRVIGAEIHVFGYMQKAPTAGQSTAGTWRGVAVVDYANSTALASLDAALPYDTHKFLTLAAEPHTAEWTPATWQVVFEKLPDQEWIQTSTTSTVFCYWKPFFAASQVDSTDTAGFITGWCDVQFRESL